MMKTLLGYFSVRTVYSVQGVVRDWLAIPAIRRALRHLKHATVLTVTAVIVGCTSQTKYQLDDDFDASPTKTQTKLTEALKCLGGQLERSIRNPGAYVFMVRDIVDGTVNNNYSDGPLADSGRIQMTSILTAHTKPSYAVVTDEFPMMFTSTGNEQVGLNRFSLPNQDNMRAYVSMLTHFTNSRRKTKGYPAVQAVLPLVIDGAFTRYDSSHIRSQGYGENFGYRGDSEDERAASVDLGTSGSERSITLVVNIIDPQRNMVVGTEGFDLKFYSNSKTARFRVAIDDFYYGLSNTDVKVETVHAAQQILLEAGAVWILDNAFGHLVDFSPCFDTDEKLALGRDTRSSRTAAEQNLVLADNIQVKPEGVAAIPEPKIVKPEATPLPKPVQPVEKPVVKASARGWRVGVGIFAQPKNVSRLTSKLRSDGFAPQSSNVTVKQGTRAATLIWLGPFSDKKLATQVSTRMTRFTGMKGYVTKDAFCERC